MEAVRALDDADLPGLVVLARAAIDELRPTKGGAVWARREARQEPIEASLAADLADPGVCVLGGTIDGVLVGYGVARIESLPDDEVLGVVSDLYVEPGARGVGVGEALMNELVGWCGSRGCIGVDSLALPGNRETKNFFESFGLVARAIVVHRRLDQQ